MLIGEAPGFHEDREGKPFRPHAPAGRVLMKALDQAGFTRYDDPDELEGRPVYITNALKCRPLDNKIDRFPDALEVCRSTFLDDEIAVVQPRVVVCLGKVAAQPYFFGETALAYRWSGERLYVHVPHPSNIARGNKDNMVKLVEGLRMAREVAYPAA